MAITSKESDLIRKINQINDMRPNISPAQHAEWEALVTEHEQYCKALAAERNRPKVSRSVEQPTNARRKVAARSTYNPADVASTEAEIRRISSKGDRRTLTEDRYLRTLQ